MQKYVLVKLLEKLEEGAEFPSSNWPLHVTIVANFAIDWNGNDITKKLQLLLAEQKPVKLIAGDDEYFGPQGNILVTVLNENDSLLSFHKKLVSLLKDSGGTFDEPQYLEDSYRAHATVQKDTRLEKGDHVLIDELSVIDMFPDEDINWRKLLKTIKLRH